MQIAWVFLIPVVAILVGAFKEWLKFRQTQERLGASNQDLVDEVASLRREGADMVRRLENLESIVTSRLWEAARGATVSPADVARLDIALGDVSQEISPRRQLQDLAEKVGI